MSKMSDMATTIEELRNAAAAINDAANWLVETFSSADDTATVPATKAPAAEPALKLEDVRAVLAEKSRAGHTAEIRSLLQKYGADKLSKIDPSNYKALLAEVEVLDNAT
ncbi:DNA ligase [Oscillospiraceae bacterium HV4-5-C5C]|nr:DNA ligase [Oscillospiraceae bacterium HV4-5-C5C]